MAEVVQRQLELMAGELKKQVNVGIIKKAEVKKIVRARTRFEYSLKRKTPKKSDYLRYIEYELNLEELRKTRSEGHKTLKPSDPLNFAILRRITSLFERALLRFKGDHTLWLQYINFVGSQDNKPLLAILLGRAVQTFPLHAGFWIMAASHELEMDNILAARALLQRGIRLNSESQRIWLQYFRMELQFLEIMRLKRKSIQSALRKQESDEQAEEPLRNTSSVKVPKVNAEENFTEDFEQSEFEESKSFYSGEIPKIIYRNAIKAIPDSLEFRLEFVEIYRSYQHTVPGREEIYQTIERDFKDSVKGQAALCTRIFWDQKASISNLLALKAACSLVATNFEKQLQETPSEALWEEYASFFFGLRDHFQLPNLIAYCHDSVLQVFQKASQADLLSVWLVNKWTLETLKTETANSLTMALEVASQGVSRFPHSEEIWLTKIRLALLSLRKEEIISSFEQALSLLPDKSIYPIWTTYLTWLVSQNGSSSEVDAKFKLAVSKCWSPKGHHNPIILKHLDWALSELGIAKFRETYEGYLGTLGLSREFFDVCVRVEQLAFEDPDLARIRKLFELALQKFQQDHDLWLSYIKLENDSREFERATTLYWRALKVVQNSSDFVAKYNQAI